MCTGERLLSNQNSHGFEGTCLLSTHTGLKGELRVKLLEQMKDVQGRGCSGPGGSIVFATLGAPRPRMSWMQ